MPRRVGKDRRLEISVNQQFWIGHFLTLAMTARVEETKFLFVKIRPRWDEDKDDNNNHLGSFFFYEIVPNRVKLNWTGILQNSKFNDQFKKWISTRNPRVTSNTIKISFVYPYSEKNIQSAHLSARDPPPMEEPRKETSLSNFIRQSSTFRATYTRLRAHEKDFRCQRVHLSFPPRASAP